MMRNFGSLAIALAIGSSLFACGGDDAPDASVSGVFPSSAFLGRKVRVEISGDVTGWKAPTVSFGEGVTVDAVKVASPSALFADITIAPEAAPGLRTVTVTEGDALTLTDAFELESSLAYKVTGTLAQGSVVALTIENHDFDAPFDTTATGDGFFEPLVFVGVSLAGPAGVTFLVDDVQPYSIAATTLIDVDATAGGVTVTSGVSADEQIVSPGASLDIQTRAAMALSGTASGMVTTGLESVLYEYTATGSPSLLQATVTSQNPDAAPGIIVLGPSGSFDELITFTDSVAEILPTGGKVYLIFWDNTGATGYSYMLKAASAALTSAAEKASNDTGATAQNATLPFAMTGATLSSDTDEDWIKVTVTAADVGKHIRVKTYGNDPFTDTRVQFFSNVAGTQAFGGPSPDTGYHEDYTSPAITAAGDIFVKIYASPEFDPASTMYDAAVFIQ